MIKIYLKDLRKSQKLTQKEFAEKIGKPRASYAFLESKSPIEIDSDMFGVLQDTFGKELVSRYTLEIDQDSEQLRAAAELVYRNLDKAMSLSPELKTRIDLMVERKAKEITKSEIKDILKELTEIKRLS